MGFRKDDQTKPPRTSAPASPAVPAAVDDPAAVNKADTHIWGVYGILVTLSVVELYSASSFEIAQKGLWSPLVRHLVMLFAGFVLILCLQRIHYRKFIHWAKWLTVISIIAMAVVMCCGQYINGARRALNLGVITIFPAEFLKLSAVMILAVILSQSQLKKDGNRRLRGALLAAGVVLLMSGLLFTQGLTNTMLLMMISMSMMVIGAIKWRIIGLIICIYAVFGGFAIGAKVMLSNRADNSEKPDTLLVDSRGNIYNVPELAKYAGGGSRMSDHTWQNRIKAWLGLGEDSIASRPKYEHPIHTGNLQEMRSYMAQAHGHWIGVFPGNSRETSRLPLAFSDYIFAIIVEDLGLIGGLFIMICYLWLLARAHYIASKCTQAFPAFLVTGLAVMITFQALFHMAIVSGAGPVSGQPLPLFSKGFTSILVTSAAFGMMLSVSRFAVRTNSAKGEQKAEEAALPENLRTANPSQL